MPGAASGGPGPPECDELPDASTSGGVARRVQSGQPRGARMPKRELEEWGGEVRVPRWLRRVFRRPDPPGDTPERGSEWRPPDAESTVTQNANRAASGALVDLYNEGRSKKR
jgi:hypothetical protein